jgi:putative addiction module component (TIGR02574 family)
MSESLKELEQRAKALSPEERARLAEILLESLEGPAPANIRAAWDREIERRAAAYDRGELQTFSAEDVFAEARVRCQVTRRG